MTQVYLLLKLDENRKGHLWADAIGLKTAVFVCCCAAHSIIFVEIGGVVDMDYVVDGVDCSTSYSRSRGKMGIVAQCSHYDVLVVLWKQLM